MTEVPIKRLFPDDDEGQPYSRGGCIPGGPVLVELADAECILLFGSAGCVRRDRRHLDAAHEGKAES